MLLQKQFWRANKFGWKNFWSKKNLGKKNKPILMKRNNFPHLEHLPYLIQTDVNQEPFLPDFFLSKSHFDHNFFHFKKILPTNL